MTNPELNGQVRSADRWGIILSGGNGTQLRDWIYHRRADYLPKQYLNFIGTRSMLEHTLHRAEKLIPAQKLFLVIAKGHLQYNEARRQTASRPQECIIVQPEDKDTGPGVLLPLLYMYKRSPDATVALFPADHFILEEDLFRQHVERAFQIVESNSARIVLLGTEPSDWQPGIGYILPGERSENAVVDDRRVEMFVDIPPPDAAKKMMSKRALWNTQILIVACKTLLQAITRAAPELYRSFAPLQEAIGTPDEQPVSERVYRELPSVNFTEGVLKNLSYENRQNLRVLPARGLTWSDWGTGDRVSRTLRRLGAPDPMTRRAAGSEIGPRVFPQEETRQLPGRSASAR